AFQSVEADVHPLEIELVQWFEPRPLGVGPSFANLDRDVPVERRHDSGTLVAKLPPRRIRFERTADFLERHRLGDGHGLSEGDRGPEHCGEEQQAQNHEGDYRTPGEATQAAASLCRRDLAGSTLNCTLDLRSS